MADHSTIEWTDATWNPITGCSVVSPGCKHCYAMGLAGSRLQHHPSRKGLTIAGKAGPVWNGEVRLNREWLTQPLQWKRPRMIFVCAHGDLFHESVPDAWIDLVFAVMALCPQHTFQVLTKRSARMRAYTTTPGRKGTIAKRVICISTQRMREARSHEGGVKLDHFSACFAGDGPFANIWLGVSAEDQRRADERVPDLLATPAAVRFVSAEPLLGPINFRTIAADDTGEIDALTGLSFCQGRNEPAQLHRLDWIIVGGESGPKARAMHPTWVREIRDPCDAAVVAFYFKQWGAWQPRAWCRDGGTHAMRVWGGQESFQEIQSHPNSIERVGAGPEWCAFALVGKKAAGRVLDGVVHDTMPPRAVAPSRLEAGALS